MIRAKHLEENAGASAEITARSGASEPRMTSGYWQTWDDAM